MPMHSYQNKQCSQLLQAAPGGVTFDVVLMQSSVTRVRKHYPHIIDNLQISSLAVYRELPI